MLRQDGFEVRRPVVYEARQPESLSTQLRVALRQDAFDYALFFSPRTATTFATLCTASKLADAGRALTALCLSPNVKAAVSQLPWQRILVAERPDQAALLGLLDRAVGHAGREGSHGGMVQR